MPPGTSTAAASVYTSCFCGHDQISAFSTTTAGVCDNVCGGAELGSIASWFRDICSVKDDDNNNGGNGNDNDNNNQNSKPTATGDASNNNSGGGGDW